MEMLKLALRSSIPFIHIQTEDLVNVETVLSHIAGKPCAAVKLSAEWKKDAWIKTPKLIYTSSECKYLATLYRHLVETEQTLVFVNTEKSAMMIDGGMLIPPKDLVLKVLQESYGIEAPENIMPALGGMTIKDIGESVMMTYTRDQSITIPGLNNTRRLYNKLRGIVQVDTNIGFYQCPEDLYSWVANNKEFFLKPTSKLLVPRGLLFDGPPGTGKTLASKYIASTFNVPLYRLDLGAMMGMYVGQSENNLNAALAQIDEIEPAVVIFDEVEKVFKTAHDSGVTSRLLSQLLWWLQEHTTRVFTVMTTNDIKAIDKELYRPGRIDRTMRFDGIAVAAEGWEFAKGVYESLLKDMGGQDAKASDIKQLSKIVNNLFHDKGDSNAVPQMQITQAIYDYVRASTTAPETIKKVA